MDREKAIAALAAREGRPGFAENVEAIKARLAELKAAGKTLGADKRQEKGR